MGEIPNLTTTNKMRDAGICEISFTEEPPAKILAIFANVQSELDKLSDANPVKALDSVGQIGQDSWRHQFPMLHDLRHTGLTLAAATGATTAELMHRAGLSSTPAALRYQHATQDRDRVLADPIGEMIKPGLPTASLKKTKSTS